MLNSLKSRPLFWGCIMASVFLLTGLCILALSGAGIAAMLYEPQPTYTPVIIIQKITATPFPTKVVVVTVLASDSPTPTTRPDIPFDIPIMDGAYDLQSSAQGTQFTYRVDADLQAVATFYKVNLPIHDWIPGRLSESSIGDTIINLEYYHSNNDVLMINLNYNPFGEFVSVQISINRADK